MFKVKVMATVQNFIEICQSDIFCITDLFAIKLDVAILPLISRPSGSK